MVLNFFYSSKETVFTMAYYDCNSGSTFLALLGRFADKSKWPVAFSFLVFGLLLEVYVFFEKMK